MKRIIVAIDGPAGAGKSTVARELARRLSYRLIDTGALYRAVALAAARAGVAFDDDEGLAALLGRVRIDQDMDADGRTRVLLDGEDVSEAIRTPQMSVGSSAVSARRPVRQGLLALQRRLGGGGGAVLEGRDIGTVVFPQAEAKFFLTADEGVRARRRYDELKAQGQPVDWEETQRALSARDRQDAQRELSPLKPAADAILVDSSGRTVDEVVEAIAADVEAIAAGRRPEKL